MTDNTSVWFSILVSRLQLGYQVGIHSSRLVRSLHRARLAQDEAIEWMKHSERTSERVENIKPV